MTEASVPFVGAVWGSIRPLEGDASIEDRIIYGHGVLAFGWSIIVGAVVVAVFFVGQSTVTTWWQPFGNPPYPELRKIWPARLRQLTPFCEAVDFGNAVHSMTPSLRFFRGFCLFHGSSLQGGLTMLPKQVSFWSALAAASLAVGVLYGADTCTGGSERRIVSGSCARPQPAVDSRAAAVVPRPCSCRNGLPKRTKS